MISFNEIVSLPGIEEVFGKQVEQTTLFTVSTDTRTISNGQLFLAIDGERYRPLQFLAQLAKAPVVVYTKNDENDKLAKASKDNFSFVAVKDSVAFLQSIARAVAAKFVAGGGKLIAISGSNGKTTTKEMLFHILKTIEEQTVCTQKNNNNHIGVPLSLLQISSKTKYCVLELGSNHPGEIEVLCDIANPNVGVTTNIGDTHLEFFENRENVFKEEGYLYYALKKSPHENKLFFLNKDDEYLSRLEPADFTRTYGSKADGNDIVIKASFDGATCELGGSKRKIENPYITGEHNFLNLALAFAIAKNLSSADDKTLLDAASSFMPTSNRSQWIEIGSAKVFLDAYNANPTSMKAAIKGFFDKSRAEGLGMADMALALGDMNELGGNGPTFHAELGKFCKELGFVNLYFIGRFAKNYNEGAEGTGEEFESVSDFCAQRKKAFLAHKAAFIKGSRSLQLESIVDIN